LCRGFLAPLFLVLFVARTAGAVAADFVYVGGYEDDICGNGIVEAAEACDDGGNAAADGCDAYCRAEPGFTCTGQPSSCFSCASVPTAWNAGFVQTFVPTTWKQLTGADTFPNKYVPAASVPHLSGVVYLGASRNNFTSVQFTVPDGFGTDVRLLFDPSQIPTTNASAGPVTISTCPGDFRVDIATPREPTDAPACKSIRSGLVVGQIFLTMTGQSTTGACGLSPGRTYYLNYTNVNPIDGITPGEWTCPADRNSCGLQFTPQ
jgi:cysteine-rich repeat protein